MGEFTVEADRASVVHTMEQSLDQKLASLFRANKMPAYHQLLAMRDLTRGGGQVAHEQYDIDAPRCTLGPAVLTASRCHTAKATCYRGCTKRIC